MKDLMAWILIISIVAVIVTVIDKKRAASRKYTRRVPESTLLTLAALGGSVCMLITMFIIRHKTRKPKFMLGIPIIIVVQAIAVYLLYKYGVIV